MRYTHSMLSWRMRYTYVYRPVLLNGVNPPHVHTLRRYRDKMKKRNTCIFAYSTPTFSLDALPYLASPRLTPLYHLTTYLTSTLPSWPTKLRAGLNEKSCVEWRSYLELDC